MVFTLLPVATLAVASIRLQFGTRAFQTSIESFSLQFLSPYSGFTLLYSPGLFLKDVGLISNSMLCCKCGSQISWCVDTSVWDG